MKTRFIRIILVEAIIFILLFPLMYGNILGVTENNQKDSFNLIQSVSRMNNRLANSPWPVFRHDLNHTGRSQYDTSKNNGQEKWNFETGNIIQSSPAIGSDGTIYIGSKDGKLYAIHPNGSLKWNFLTRNGIYSSPAIDSDGIIYFSSDDNKLYAFYPNGTQKWNYTVWGFESSPIIGTDGIIYIGSGINKLFAIYPNGTQKWNYTTESAVDSSPAINSDGTIYFGSNDGRLYALYPNGTEKWNYSTGDAVVSSPAIGSDGTIYVGSDDNKLYALNPNGTKKWDFSTKDSIYSASPAIGIDGTIYIGSGDGGLHAIYPNGTEKWNFVIGRVVNSSPAIGSDGTIYVGAEDNKLYALYPNGTKRWDFTTKNPIESSPTIDSDGIIYIGSFDNKLYAIGTSNPMAPKDLLVLGGNAKIILTWESPIYSGASAISTYIIYRGMASGCETKLVEIGNITSYIDKDLINGQKYYYKITAKNSFGEGLESNEASATPSSRPSAPKIENVILGNSQITLNWNPPLDYGGLSITNYTIYRNGTRHLILGDILTFTDSVLINGMTYTYNISANNSDGESPLSIGIIGIPRSIPSVPRNIMVNLGNAKVILSWHVPESNGGAPIISYNIYRRTSTSNESLLISSYIDGTSWVDTNITVGITYYYMICAVNIAGEGFKSNELSATPYSVPGTPVLFVNGGDLKNLLSWTVPSSNGASISNYNVYRSTISGNETVFIKGYSGGTSWVDMNITVGIKYYYIVSAVNIAGEGPKSNEVNIIAGILPSIPIGLTLSEGDSKVILNWSERMSNLTPTQYTIYRSDTKNGKYNPIATTNSTRYIDSRLTNGKEYWYKINAQNMFGVSENTTSVSATPYVTSNNNSLLLIIIIILIIVIIAIELSRKKKI